VIHGLQNPKTRLALRRPGSSSRILADAAQALSSTGSAAAMLNAPGSLPSFNPETHPLLTTDKTARSSGAPRAIKKNLGQSDATGTMPPPLSSTARSGITIIAMTATAI
jgi:hypothetical protein